MEKLHYSEQYIESCFYAWYRAGAPGLRGADGTNISPRDKKVMDNLPVSENGRKPSIQRVYEWMNKFAWRERADVLDAQVSVRIDEEVIQERVKTLRELSDVGDKMMKKGIEFIVNKEDPFADNPSAAVRAVLAGSEMKFKYAGQADLLASITLMNDKQVEREILKYLGKESDDNNDNENIVDVESEEISEDDKPEDDNA